MIVAPLGLDSIARLERKVLDTDCYWKRLLDIACELALPPPYEGYLLDSIGIEFLYFR